MRLSRLFFYLASILLFSNSTQAALQQKPQPIIFEIPFSQYLMSVMASSTHPSSFFAGSNVIVFCQNETCASPKNITLTTKEAEEIWPMELNADASLLAFSTLYNAMVADMRAKPAQIVARLGNGYVIEGVKFSADGKKLIVARGNEVVIWDYMKNTTVIPPELKNADGGAMFLSQLLRTDTFAIPFYEGVAIWNLSNPTPRIVNTSVPEMMVLTFGNDEDHFVCCTTVFSSKGQIQIFSGSDSKVVSVGGYINELAYCPKIGLYFFTVSDDSFCNMSVQALNPDDASVVELIDLRPTNVTKNSYETCYSMSSFSDDGTKLLVTAGGNNTVVRYANLNTLELYKQALLRDWSLMAYQK